MVTRQSSADSKMADLRASTARSSSTARFDSVMSRATADVPATAPAASRIGERVTDTSIVVPSLRTRWVSNCLAGSPRRKRPAVSGSSPDRSGGTSIGRSLPIASAAM